MMKRVKMIAFVASMMMMFLTSACEDSVFQKEQNNTECCHANVPPKEDSPDED